MSEHQSHAANPADAAEEQAALFAHLVMQQANMAMMFLGIVVPAGVLWHLTEGGFNVTQHAGRAWKMFKEAIATA